MTGPKHTRRNPGIDALRGVSIVLVILFHIHIRLPIHKTDLVSFLPERLLWTFTTKGFEGVFIFFVISGFLITKHTIRRHGTLPQIDLRAFYIRRAARILPFLFLLVAILSALHLMRVPDFTINLEKQSLSRAIASVLLLHVNWYEATTGYLPGSWDVMWSLSIEEVFYIGFPLICVLLRRQWLLIIVFSVLALSLPYTRGAISDNPMWMSKAYLPSMAGIAAGVLGALAVDRIQKPHRILIHGLRWGGGIGIITVLAIPNTLWPWIGHSTILMLTVSTALCLMGMDLHVRDGEVKPWPGLQWLRSFGRLSYEIYLTHMFVVLPLAALAVKLGNHPAHGHYWYLPIVAASWIPGVLASRYYTNPCDQALRRRWLSGTRSDKAATMGRQPPP